MMSCRTGDGTATTSDYDYVAETGTLTFAPVETKKTVTIEVKGDSKMEPDETTTPTCSAIAVTLSPLTRGVSDDRQRRLTAGPRETAGGISPGGPTAACPASPRGPLRTDSPCPTQPVPSANGPKCCLL